MTYRRADDQLFGKYCYIDTPWIAGKKTIYRIIRSGVWSNAWCEVPVNGRTEKVNHGEHTEEIVFVVLDTLIDENTEIMRFALKDVEIIEMADRKTENGSEKPNNCEHITEDGVTCAKYPACDNCPDNPLNKVKGSERLVKGSEKPNNCEDDEYWKHLFIEVVKGHMSDAEANQAWYEYINRKTEPQLTPNYCGTCKYRDVPCGDLPCDVCHGYSNYEPKTEPTGYNLSPVEDEPQERSE